MIISATISLPPTANNCYRNVPGKGRVKTSSYKAWLTEAGYIIKLAARAKKIDGAYTLTLRIGKPDGLRRDLDNLIKPISDALVAAGAVKDDSLCERYDVRWTSSREGVFLTAIPCAKVEPVAKPEPRAA